MNYDRFLTRVFDTQEKRMLYLEDYIGRHYIIESITSIGIKVYDLFEENPEMRSVPVGDFCTYDRYKILPFAHRFIPMQCAGRKCINVKPVYSGDIVKGHYIQNKRISFDGEESIKIKITNGIVTRSNNGSFIVVQDGEYICDCYWVFDLEIIGNIHENPELMEEKK